MKRLAEMREKLDRIQTGPHNIRGKEKKVDALQKSITDLELKVSVLQNAESTPEQSAAPSAVQIMQNALGAPVTDSTFTPINVKREQLDRALPSSLNGPGSKQQPMQVDCESSEDVDIWHVFHRFVVLLG
jgi:hypothetical protein